MHVMKVCHRDIKVENVLYNIDQQTGKEIFKLCDFGSATYDHSISYNNASKQEVCEFIETVET